MYDLAIVGAGPAGLTASIYSSCFKLKNIVLGSKLGGQILVAPGILNAPGFEIISGKELASLLINQAKKRGAEVFEESVTGITASSDFYTLISQSQEKYQAKAIILATGIERRRLNIDTGEVSGKDLVVPLGVAVDVNGFIQVNDKMATNVAGIFAAGDLVNSRFGIEQIAISVGEGARAAMSAYEYITGQKPPTVWGSSQIRRPRII